jgi:hypothetical protein
MNLKTDVENNPFPVRPTLVPQARRYTRNFKAGEGRVFTEGDQITIDIPPMNNTYLTKDARIYFKFDLSFYDHSFTSSATQPAGIGVNWWAGTASESWVNIQRKPVPMLDVCGPYGFFRDVEVYDYLGNTLIEKTQRHDLLAATMADFYLDSEVDRLRPTISDSFNPILSFSKAQNAMLEIELLPHATGPMYTTRVNGINLLDENLNANEFNNDTTRNADYYSYVVTPPRIPADLVKVPTWYFSIQLLNFLGKGSPTFVPLHNGYRIVLKLNQSTVPIKFGLPSGNLVYKANVAGDPALDPSYVDVSIVPKISEYNLYDVELIADVLQISPQFDEQIDKVIHTQMTSHVLLGRCDKPTIIPGNFLSANRMTVQMHAIPYDVSIDSFAELGTRFRTNVCKARLLLNDAVHQEFKSIEEIKNALGTEYDSIYNAISFFVDDPPARTDGSGGYMYPYLGRELKWALKDASLIATTYINWANQEDINPMFTRFNDNMGRFLLKFDLSLNGYNNKVITGIDTTKTTVKLDLTRDSSPNYAYETDIFIDYDAIITVVPGKSTSVSF